MELVFEAAVKKVEERRKMDLVYAAFNALPPQERLERLAAIFGDTVITQALEAEREKELRRLSGEVDYDELKAGAFRHNKFDPRDLPPGTSVQLGLSEKSRLSTKVRGQKQSRVLDLVYEGDFDFTVTRDYTPEDVKKSETLLKAVPPQPGNTLVSVWNGNSPLDQRDPVLFFGEPINIVAEDQQIYPEICLGELTVNGRYIKTYRPL